MREITKGKNQKEILDYLIHNSRSSRRNVNTQLKASFYLTEGESRNFGDWHVCV